MTIHLNFANGAAEASCTNFEHSQKKLFWLWGLVWKDISHGCQKIASRSWIWSFFWFVFFPDCSDPFWQKKLQNHPQPKRGMKLMWQLWKDGSSERSYKWFKNEGRWWLVIYLAIFVAMSSTKWTLLFYTRSGELRSTLLICDLHKTMALLIW